MKYIFTFSLLFTFIIGFSQKEHKVKFDNPNAENVLFISNKTASITIEAYASNEIVFSAEEKEINSYFNKKKKSDPKRKEGLKPIYPGGIYDNSGIGYNISKSDNKISLRQVGKHLKTLHIRVPKNVKIYIEEANSHRRPPCKCEYNIIGTIAEVQVKTTYGTIEFDNINGPVVLESTFGAIQGRFNQISSKGPSSINATYGIVDIALNRNAKVNVTLAASMGQAYTDFDIQQEKLEKEETKKSKVIIANRWTKDVHHSNHPFDYNNDTGIKGTINGGGTPIRIASLHGDIYLRKK